jgi:hypothetical protein
VGEGGSGKRRLKIKESSNIFAKKAVVAMESKE